MSDFPVNIRVDKAGTDAAIRSVTTELDRTERAAKKAEDAIKKAVQDGAVHWTKAAEAQKKLTEELINSERAAEKLKAATSGVGAQLRQLQSLNFGTGLAANIGLAGQAAMGFASSLFNMAQAVAGFMVSMAAVDDGMVMMRNRLRGVTNGQDELTAAMLRTREIADRTRTDVEVTRDAYARTANVTNQLGFTADRTGRFTETLSKMFAASGRSATESSAAMLQLSQALGSGVLQGDEFRSIAENMPQLLDLMARQLNTTRGQLKGMAADGKITTDIMVKAIEGSAQRVDIAFAQMETTFAQRMRPWLNEMKENPLALAQQANSAANVGGSVSTLATTAPEINPVVSLFRGVGGLSGNNVLKGMFDEMDTGNLVVTEFNRQIGESVLAADRLHKALGGKAAPAVKSFDDQLKAHIESQRKAHPEYFTWEDNLDRLLKKIQEADPELKKLTENTNKQAEALEKLKGSTGPIGTGAFIDNLIADGKNLLVRMGVPGVDSFSADKLKDAASKFHELADKAKAAWKAVDDGINGPLRNFRRDVAIMDGMLAKHIITVEQYGEKYRQMFGALSSFDKQRSNVNVWSAFLMPPDGLVEKIDSVTAAWKKLTDEIERSMDLTPGGRGAGRDKVNEAQSFATMDPTQRYLAELDKARFEGNEGSGLGAVGAQGAANERAIERATQALAKQRKEWQEWKTMAETALRPVEDGFNRLFTTGEFGFRKMVDDMIAQLTRLATHALFARGIGALFGGGPTLGGGGSPGSAAAALAAIQGGATGATWTVPGFATGGMAHGVPYRVQGRGGIDSVPIPLGMVSPGETVTVTPRSAPMQQAAPQVNTRVIVQQDPRALLDAPGLDERIERVVLKMRR